MHRKLRSRSFDLLSMYDYFRPDFRGLGWIMFWLVVGYLIAQAIAIVALMLLGQDGFRDYGNLIVYPIMFIPPMIYAAGRSRSSSMFEKGYAMDGRNFLPLGGIFTTVLAAVATIAVAMVTDAVSMVLPEMTPRWKEALKMIMDAPLWATLLSVSVFAPLFEEWLCRGMVLRGLLSKVKPVWAIVISAAFFGLIHFNPWQAIPAFTLGCLFGWVYYRTGSLKLTMLMHCVNNTFAALTARIPGLEDVENFVDVFPDKSHYWAIWVGCLFIAAFCIYLLAKIRPLSPEGSCKEVEISEF